MTTDDETCLDCLTDPCACADLDAANLEDRLDEALKDLAPRARATDMSTPELVDRDNVRADLEALAPVVADGPAPELGGALARSAAIQAAASALLPGTIRRAALPVTLRERETAIPIPSSVRDRRIVALGVRPPEDVGEMMLLRDVVLEVHVGGTVVWSTPITFLPAIGNPSPNGVITEGRPIRPALVLPPGANAAVRFKAFCTLPARGLGLVLYADVLTVDEAT